MDRLKAFRRIAIWVVVVSLSIAAVLGIYVILTGNGGELEARVMGTTAATGGFGILVLAYLSTLGRPFQWVGFLGFPVAALTYAYLVTQIWAGFDDGEGWRLLSVGTLLAVALAHGSLIVQLIRRPQPALRWIVGITLATIAGYAVLGGIPILSDSFAPGEAYWRLLGTVVILCVLGTVVSPVLGAILRTRGTDQVRVVLDLPADLAARIDAAGPRAAVVADVLRQAFPTPDAAASGEPRS